jgi:hypothetical protein
MTNRMCPSLCIRLFFLLGDISLEKQFMFLERGRDLQTLGRDLSTRYRDIVRMF